jgi:hypothetical protein
MTLLLDDENMKSSERTQNENGKNIKKSSFVVLVEVVDVVGIT